MTTYHATLGDGIGFEFIIDHVDDAAPVRIKWDHDDAGVWVTTPWQSADVIQPAEKFAETIAAYFATGEDDEEFTVLDVKTLD